MQIIPAIDLRDGRCVRLSQGKKDLVTSYSGKPAEVARAFEVAGATMLHVVDLDAAFGEVNSRNRIALCEIIRSVNIPLQVGGGLRTTKDVERVISLGVSRVVIGTVAAESPETLTKMLNLFHSKHIVVGIDARGRKVVTRGWESELKVDAVSLAKMVASLGVERIVYTDVRRDGMLSGPNIEETGRVATESGLRVTASGGVSSLDDIRELQEASVTSPARGPSAACGIDSVIIGKALYEGRFTLEEALRIREHSTNPTHGSG
ncbi:MAG TPA: 1-(5-phosphoribosyl)-5-[(5-phosphoribosylamino)methylideneamino]imidazole-4-carboxamide isomerase [Pyrinomonadaceae bacterium]|nr:1-(5-phosphoribosyl)-5-[(5-phosphoribosylamino)methylideneamino]imidazole-4-carboxamide isomerase [Pyrinomonadaceae bacterium]